MERIFTLIMLMIISLYSCRPEIQSQNSAVDFGIFETVDSWVMTDSVRNQFSDLRIKLSKDIKYPVIGYCVTHDKIWRDSLREINTPDNIRVAVTAKPMNDEGMHYAVVALRIPAIIDISDIDETIGGGDHVEIRFNMRGAKKWAEMTEKNMNKQAAFLVEDRIYDLPYITAGIRSGTALITGLDTVEAETITGLLMKD